MINAFLSKHFFLSSLWTSGCLFAILWTDFCAFSLENCVICIIVPKLLKDMGFFSKWDIFTPDVSSLSLSLSPGKWGGKSYTFCILSDLLFSLSHLFCFWYPLLFTDTYCIFKQFKLIQLILFHCLEYILQFSPAIYTTWGIYIIDTGCDSCSYFLCV